MEQSFLRGPALRILPLAEAIQADEDSDGMRWPDGGRLGLVGVFPDHDLRVQLLMEALLPEVGDHGMQSALGVEASQHCCLV
jgi:hypothetical protein